MTSIYSFTFDFESTKVIVHFVNDKKSIDVTESLAQIGHQHRRSWAKTLITQMINSKMLIWNLQLKDKVEQCPFEQRLLVENWTEPVARLVLTSTQRTLHIYRLYYFII